MGFLLTSSKNRLVIAHLMLIAMLGLPAHAAQKISSLPTFFEPARIAWRSLSYTANNIFGKATTDVFLSTSPAEEVADFLIAVPGGGAVHASGATVFSIKVHSNINPLVGFDEILKTQSWIDSNAAAALQRIRLRLGQEKWQKSYRFTDKGVYRLRTKPQDTREDELPPEQWTKARNSFYPYDAASSGCSAVLESSSLLMVASVIKQMKPDTALHLCVFNKQQLHQVKVSVDGLRSLKVNYLEKSGTNQTRRENAIDAIKISFQPRSLALNNEDPEEFSFLGLKGDFDIYVDQDSGLPVQVSGKIATFGKIDIRLQTVEFAPNVR
jgi:hypothetical protein